MAENKLKHLEFIQNVINRMNNNSFLIKGWVITLICALFVLAAKDANKGYVLITYIVVPVFWILDSFYLSQEKQYRELYNKVAKTDEPNIDFSMNASSFNKGRNTWLFSMFTKTLTPFYGITILISLLVMYFLNK